MTGFHYFTFRDRRSIDYGLYVVEKSTYDAPERDVTVQEIPGRSGDLIIDNGRFKNLPISYKVAVLPGTSATMREAARKIKRWLLSGVGYFMLADTYDDYYFRYGEYHSALGLEESIPGYAETTIAFNCKPFRYSFEGHRARELTLPGPLHNPEEFTSKPYIKIVGSGAISLHIGNKTFSFVGVDEYIEIDSELMNVYKGAASQNIKARTEEFPTLAPGENNITWTGNVSSVEIVPRWCTL